MNTVTLEGNKERPDNYCPECGGQGLVVVGENRVTQDMAIDAGDRSLEGAFHSYAYDTCPTCEGRGEVNGIEIWDQKQY